LSTFHSYAFTDYSPLNGNNYYKLVHVDNDGKGMELGVRTVTYNVQRITFNLYPNPTDNDLTVSFTSGSFTQLKVIDLTGKVLQHVTINGIENSKQLSLGTYPAGTYIIQLNGKGQVKSKKIIKR